MRLLSILTALCCLAFGLSLPAVAAPLPAIPAALQQDLDAAEEAFRIQSYATVLDSLDHLVEHPLLEAHPEHLRVLELLGVSHWFLGHDDSARLIFGRLLRENPFHRLDIFVYPPELIEVFEKRRNDLIRAGVIPDKRDDSLPSGRTLIREIQHDSTPTFVYLLPFGLGQFANQEPGKGTTFAVLQGLGLGSMLASTVTIASMERDRYGRILYEDAQTAKIMRGLWFGGAALFAGAWIYSITDGFLSRPTEQRVEERYELIPVKETTQLRLQPGPGDFGLALDLSF